MLWSRGFIFCAGLEAKAEADTGVAALGRRIRTGVALAVLSISLASCSTVPRSEAGGGFTRDFGWQYGGRTYEVALDLHPATYAAFRRRERTRDYDLFASDYHGKPFIGKVTRKLAEQGRASGLSRAELQHLVVSFVQNLPYTSDEVTTGYDEYPRFPYETLYDRGGDCEDTSILASALLHELGYEVALLLFPGHVAVGVECRPQAGQPHYRHRGRRYCYLETTGKDWVIGEVPPSVYGLAATVKPVMERPEIAVEFVARYHRRDGHDTVTVAVSVRIRNLGSQTARGARVHVALRKPGTGLVWDQIRSDRFRLDPEAGFSYEVTDLQVADGEPFQVYVQVGGTNFSTEEVMSEVLAITPAPRGRASLAGWAF